MIIKCINSSSCLRRLTEGKLYTVLPVKQEKGYYKIKDDMCEGTWYAHRFIVVQNLNNNIKIL